MDKYLPTSFFCGENNFILHNSTDWLFEEKKRHYVVNIFLGTLSKWRRETRYWWTIRRSFPPSWLECFKHLFQDNWKSTPAVFLSLSKCFPSFLSSRSLPLYFSLSLCLSVSLSLSAFLPTVLENANYACAPSSTVTLDAHWKDPCYPHVTI